MSRTTRRAAVTDPAYMPRPRRTPAAVVRRARRTATRQAYIARHLTEHGN